MKPLVTTVRALRELATGISPSAVQSSPILFSFDGPNASFLLSAEDEPHAQRAVLIRDSNAVEQFVPDHLAPVRAGVLSRMASFVEHARTHPISLPRGWHQYKHNNLVAFFASPSGDEQASRWIAEITTGEHNDVIFWQTTTSNNKSALSVFAALNRRLDFDLNADWSTAFDMAARQFAEARKPDVHDVDINLPALSLSTTKGWSYEQWLDAVSDDQQAFINAPVDRSIRLRGPAGSGKTLALTIKAVKAALASRETGSQSSLRVLIATHSWALAAQIDESIKSMGVGFMGELDVFPLLEIATSVSPAFQGDGIGFNLIGEDSYSGKQAQLDEIDDLLHEFLETDWVTYKRSASNNLRQRIDSPAGDDRKALAWDLLIEFGSVIGAAAIFPGAGSEAKYLQLQRASWMLPLHSREDKRVVFAMYTRYMERLEARSLMTSDQVLADFLSHLETHAWNRTRKSEGYDLIFVDEFHLFSPLERQVLHYLTRDVATYPSIFMAIDPRQSPSEAFIGIAAEETLSSTSSSTDASFGEVTNFELSTVHRFTPEILSLIKHVHHEFPTFDLGQEWDIDFSAVESSQSQGPLPQLVSAASRGGEETDIYRALHDMYSRGRMALAVVDTRQWHRYSELAATIGQSAKYHVATISGRSDIEGLGYRHRGLVVGPAEYLAGLQFETVLVAGLPDLQHGTLTVNDKTRLLSLLYLAMSRAEREVRVFVNDDDGGAPEVLLRAVANGVMTAVQGSET